MAIRIIPPKISILSGLKRLSLSPRIAPANDSAKVAVPMIIIGVIMGAFRKAKLKPTAKASMLVAIDKIRSTQVFSGFVFLWASGFVDS